MVFSSVIFLFFFLPIILSIYYLLGKGIRNIFLTMASLAFYFWGENYLIWIMIVSTLIDYICGLIISGAKIKGEIKKLEPGEKRSRRAKIGLIISVSSNLAFLAYFKYSNFFVDSFISAYGVFGIDPGILKSFGHIALPLGISFYTFQSMSYSIDVYLGQVKATRNFINFACYVTLFPQLVAGPIVRYQDIQSQLDNHNVKMDDFSAGVLRFVFGLVKKVLIANSVAQVADSIFSLPNSEIGFSLAWLGVLAYTIQIYFDFSGYSDMAIGLGQMFGFRFLENFNYPYIATSIQDFWRRWHISLSTWWRDYLYIPLGGSKGGEFRTYLNLVIVFFLCGLWHGAKWTFVAWGMYQGMFLIIERMGFSKILKSLPVTLRHFYTIIVFMFGWVIFRAEDFKQAVVFIKAMIGASGGFNFTFITTTNKQTLTMLIIGVIFSTPLYPQISAIYGKIRSQKGRSWIVADIIGYTSILALFLLCILSLSANTYNPFIYYRF